ncbi:uncharacterized protein TRAVEDRAFT_59736 [Trametes versicolor FP-101664 SS1]|uniref:uncharacterized protein n=1 Tax=Trametes versicolor (strain FP-101664) TaxID=717944 RepID=UPI00046239A2|nr:uncharacterized protein TRAVEDRAFT_59736 [Trametes versicolor FP-101664 SS1]EIW56887.1 hypothetical protein TRAVEDRAFT_59736 [Trametes versicolor FP-101664 SS1]
MGADDLNKTILTSFLISFFLDCLFYGIFFVAYAITMWLLLFAARRRKGQSRSRDIAHAGLLTVMLGLAFVYLVLDVVVNIHAFEGDGGNLAAAEAVFVVSNPESLWGPKLGVLVTQMILADAYLIYRVYVVYSSSLVVTAAPAFFLVCEAAFGFTTVHYQIHPGIAAIPEIMSILFFASSLVTNVLSTGLIAGRIIRSNRRVREFRMSGVGRTASRGSGVVDIIVQSAAVYSCALIVILIAMFTATVQPLVVLGVLPSLAGAVFSAVIIRTRLSDATSPEVHQVDFRGQARLMVPQRVGTGLSIVVSREIISSDDAK